MMFLKKIKNWRVRVQIHASWHRPNGFVWGLIHLMDSECSTFGTGHCYRMPQLSIFRSFLSFFFLKKKSFEKRGTSNEWMFNLSQSSPFRRGTKLVSLILLIRDGFCEASFYELTAFLILHQVPLGFNRVGLGFERAHVQHCLLDITNGFRVPYCTYCMLHGKGEAKRKRVGNRWCHWYECFWILAP